MKLRRFAAFFMAMVLTLGLMNIVAAYDPQGRIIRILYIEGDSVTASRGAGRSANAREGQRLNEGHSLATGVDSFVYITLDELAVVKMDQQSQVAVSQVNSNRMAITVQSGNALVDAGQLNGNQLIETLVGSVVMTVRGTVYVMGLDNGWVTISMLEGYGEVMGVELHAGYVMRVLSNDPDNGTAEVQELDLETANLFTLQAIYDYQDLLLEIGVLAQDDLDVLTGLINQLSTQQAYEQMAEYAELTSVAAAMQVSALRPASQERLEVVEPEAGDAFAPVDVSFLVPPTIPGPPSGGGDSPAEPDHDSDYDSNQDDDTADDNSGNEGDSEPGDEGDTPKYPDDSGNSNDSDNPDDSNNPDDSEGQGDNEEYVPSSPPDPNPAPDPSPGPSGAILPPGAGLQLDPYRIYTIGHLKWVAEYHHTLVAPYFLLMNDIAEPVDFIIAPAIGATTSPFSGPTSPAFNGVFNGQHHSLQLNIGSPYNVVGFFGYLGSGARVENLVLTGMVQAVFADYVGAVVGWSRGGKVHNNDVSGLSIATGASFSSAIVGVKQGGAITGNVPHNNAGVSIP